MATSNCRNISEVEAWLQPKIEIIVNEVLAGIEEWNKKEIERVVYGAGYPMEYERTYEFKEDAWKGEITNSQPDSVTGEFAYYPEGMETVDYMTGQHASVISGDDMRPYLAEIIYEGLANKNGNSPFGSGFWTQKRDAWSALLKVAKVDGAKMKTWIRRGAKKAKLEIRF